MLLQRATVRTISLAALLALGGCYVEDVKDRAPAPGSEPVGGRRGNESGQCRYTSTTGCLQASIPAAPELTVDGIKFMDANDLAQRFSELVPIEANDPTEPGVTATEPKLTLSESLDNSSFADEFQIFMRGAEGAKSALALPNGGFIVNKLTEDTYRVRVQKQIRFDISREITRAVTTGDAAGAPGAAPVTSEVKKTVCATLYSDAAVDIRMGERTSHVFTNYKLYLTDNACPDYSAQATLKL